jgi:hypothetical protein
MERRRVTDHCPPPVLHREDGSHSGHTLHGTVGKGNPSLTIGGTDQVRHADSLLITSPHVRPVLAHVERQ